MSVVETLLEKNINKQYTFVVPKDLIISGIYVDNTYTGSGRRPKLSCFLLRKGDKPSIENSIVYKLCLRQPTNTELLGLHMLIMEKNQRLLFRATKSGYLSVRVFGCYT